MPPTTGSRPSPSTASGAAWVAYDSYQNGNYDVFLRQVTEPPGPEIAVAASPDFEARATVAVDTADRVWVAYENGPQNWGKDQGYVLTGHALGAPLGGAREARIRCYDHGQWREPRHTLASLFGGRVGQRAGLPGETIWDASNVAAYTGANSFQPHVYLRRARLGLADRQDPDGLSADSAPQHLLGISRHSLRRQRLVEASYAAAERRPLQHAS